MFESKLDFLKEEVRLNFFREEAKAAGIEFNLEEDDLRDIPEFCEVFGIEIDPSSSNKDHWPFLWMIDKKLGWVKGNIKFISRKAGSVMRNLSIKEIEQVLHYMKKDGQRGSNNVHSKLAESDVKKIRELSLVGVSQRKLAKRFGVSDSTIGRIVRKEKWKHVV